MVQMYIWGDVFSGREAFEESVALKKTSPDFGVNFVRGMLCNWLVNIATWQAMTAQVRAWVAPWMAGWWHAAQGRRH